MRLANQNVERSGEGECMSNQRPRLLHVDDDSSFRELFPILYARWFDVASVADPTAALALLAQGGFDALVTDFDMPVMDGLDLLRQVRDAHPGLPVFLYTGQGSEDVARQAFQEGACDYFVKSLAVVGHTDSVAHAILKGLEARRLQERLRLHRENIEALVEERARELVALNEALQHEVQERRKVEAELRRQSALAERFFEGNPYSVHMLRRDGRSYRTNAAHYRMWGATPPTDIDCVAIMVSMYPEFGPMLERVYAGETVHFPPVLCNPAFFDDGCAARTVYSATVAFPVMDEQGECEYVVLMHEDVTGRVLAEQALERACRELRRQRGDTDPSVAIVEEVERRRQAEEQLLHSRGSYRIIFESSNDGIFLHRAGDGRLVECNGKALEMFEMTAEEVDSFLPLGELPRLAPGGSTVVERQVRTATGRAFWSEITVKRVEMGGEDCLLTLVRDIDRGKTAELELQRKNRELQDAFYMVTHDLKNPLCALEMHVELLRHHPERVGPVCGILGQELTGVRSFIDDLLRLTLAGKVIDDDRRQALDTATFLRAVLGHTNHRKVPVTFNVRGELPPLHGDPVKLEEVFRNLFVNALENRRTAEGGVRITVSWEGRELCVEDDGRGILPVHLPHLFDAGFTRSGSGTGFGLAIARRLVEAHGGSIRAESEGSGRGARFFLELPVAPAALATAPGREAAPRGRESRA